MRFEKVGFNAFRKDMLRCGWAEEIINDAYEKVKLPERKTRHSAGYDFVAPVGFIVRPKEKIVVPTGIKAYFSPEEASQYHLQLFVRSSVGIKFDLVLSNGTGVIDGDYYGNPNNEGDMLMALYNRGMSIVKIDAGDRLMQGVFVRHGIAEGDETKTRRTGGVGSTDK